MSGSESWASQPQPPQSLGSSAPRPVPDLASQVPSSLRSYSSPRLRRIFRQASSRPLRLVIVLTALLTAIVTPQALGLGSTKTDQIDHRPVWLPSTSTLATVTPSTTPTTAPSTTAPLTTTPMPSQPVTAKVVGGASVAAGGSMATTLNGAIGSSSGHLVLSGQPYRFVGVNAYEIATDWGVNGSCGTMVSDAQLGQLFSSLPPNSLVRFWAWQGSAAINVNTHQIDWGPLDRVFADGSCLPPTPDRGAGRPERGVRRGKLEGPRLVWRRIYAAV